MPNEPKSEQGGTEVKGQNYFITKATLLALFGVLATAVAFLSNFGQMCDSHTIGWRVKFVCDWIAEPKPVDSGNTQSPISSDLEIAASNERLAVIKEVADKWRSRTGPIYESIKKLLDGITTFDKRRFPDLPLSGEAWNYLQSVQKIIESENSGMTEKNKSDIPINVYVSGTNEVGDRAARSLDEWLKDNNFNIEKNNSSIYVYITGDQYSDYDARASNYYAKTAFNISAKWLDGNAFIKETKTSPSIGWGGTRANAEDQSFSKATEDLFNKFLSQVRN